MNATIKRLQAICSDKGIDADVTTQNVSDLHDEAVEHCDSDMAFTSEYAESNGEGCEEWDTCVEVILECRIESAE